MQRKLTTIWQLRPQYDPTVDSPLPWGKLNVENDVAVLKEKQNFLQTSWRKMAIFFSLLMLEIPEL